jgi:hypothetical protein
MPKPEPLPESKKKRASTPRKPRAATAKKPPTEKPGDAGKRRGLVPKVPLKTS